MHAEELVVREANGRSLVFVDTKERERESNRRRKIAIALPTPIRAGGYPSWSSPRSLSQNISGTRELWIQIKEITEIIIEY